MAKYRCSICDQIFYNPVPCKNHLESEHSDQEGHCIELMYKCPTCGRVFGHPTDVKNHALLEHKLQKVDVIAFTP